MERNSRLMETFLQLVSIDAESFHEREIADFVKQRLLQLGLTVWEDDVGERLFQEGFGENREKMAGNIGGFLKGNREGTPILLSAHLDTVCPGQGKRGIRQKDGKITSAGDTVLGADDAAGIAAILELMALIQEEQLPHGDLEIVFPVAEEPFAQGSRRLDYSKLHAREAYVLDMSGTIGRAAYQAPAIATFQVDIQGQSAHAGFSPEKGIHAIAIAADAIHDLQLGRTDPDTTVNIGTIAGGIARNIIPETCTVTGEIRSFHNDQVRKQLEQIQSVFRKYAESYHGQVHFTWQEEFRAYSLDRESQVVQRFLQACTELGLPGELVETFGGSDNNHFAEHGIQGLVLSCGMHEVHSCREYTTEQELEDSVRLLLRLVSLA